MSTPRGPLRTALHNRLTGNDGDGLGIGPDVFLEGAVPKGQDAPYVVIVRIRSTGTRLLDDTDKWELRADMRVHTRFEPGKANAKQRSDIATAVYDSLRGAELSVTGARPPVVLPPNEIPQPPYTVGNKTAFDLIVRFDFLF